MHNFGRHPRREIAMSYPPSTYPFSRNHTHRSPGVPLPDPSPFAAPWRFSRSAPPDRSCDPMDVPDAGPRPNSRKTPRNSRKTRCFCEFCRPHMRRPASPNYTPSAPDLRLIATQLSGQIGCTKRRVKLPGLLMSKRSAKFVPALFASVLAGANLATVTDLRAQATQAQATQPPADDCLTAPKGATPAGGHWYYRIDRATKRKCWYLRDDSDKASDKSARAAPQDSTPATPPAVAEPAPQQPRTITRKAISDARAEWISQQSRAEQNSPANVDPRTTGAVSAPTVQDGKRAIGANVLAPTPLATTRWFDSSGVNSSSNPADVSAPPRSPISPRTNSNRMTPSRCSSPPCNSLHQGLRLRLRTRRRQSQRRRCRCCFW